MNTHPNWFRIAGFFLAIAAALSFSACSSTPKKKKRTILMTEYDDVRAGEQGAASVAAQIGIMPDKALNDYVNKIGRRLLLGVPRRSFRYKFSVVDQTEPNAFALPGGHIFISRGLLALANNEDELACVIGHEITHANQRHSALQQGLAKRGLAIGYMQASRMASYSREMERAADRGGQILCAAAGYNPMGMSTFLRSLDQNQRLELGYIRGPGFLDSHPGASERAAANAARVGEMRWKPDPRHGDTRASLLEQTAGLVVGHRPESGVFAGNLFLHPDMDFQLHFPTGWLTPNTTVAVGAIEPRQEAVVFLTADLPEGDPRVVAEDWFEDNREAQNMKIVKSEPVKIGHIDGWRLRITAGGRGARTSAYVTFIPFHEATWSISGVTSTFKEKTYLDRTLLVPRSFRPLGAENRKSIRSTHLEVVTARPGESLVEISKRTGNAWNLPTTAVYNGVFVHHQFKGGEMVKIIKSRHYISPVPAS